MIYFQEQGTYPADNIVVICKVSLALLAAKDFVGVQVDVVRKTHVCSGSLLFHFLESNIFPRPPLWAVGLFVAEQWLEALVSEVKRHYPASDD